MGKARIKRSLLFSFTFILIMLMSLVSNAGVLSAPTASAATYTYTIKVEGSIYVAKNNAGNTVASGSDFGAVFNTLNSKLIAGNTVHIYPGMYLAKTYGILTQRSIVVSGEPGTIIRSASLTLPVSYLFMIVGSYNTVTGITFDAYKNTKISPSVVIGGSYNTISNCRCINALQYNLEASRANHFKILDNYCTNSQYGIATMGFDSWCTDGLISGNTITDCQSAGIKIRCAINVIVQNNYIDCAYIQYTSRYSYPSAAGMTGLYLANIDGPSVGVTFQNNRVVDTKMEKQTRGVFMQSEDSAYWLSKTSIRTSDILISKNTFQGLYIPITTTGTYCTLSENIIIPRVLEPPTGSSSITVTAPNGGEHWAPGKVYAITWSRTGITGNYVRIELLKAGSVVKVIASSAVNNGVQKWLIPLTQALGSDYKIRITSTTYTSFTDSSNANFSITS